MAQPTRENSLRNWLRYDAVIPATEHKVAVELRRPSHELSHVTVAVSRIQCDLGMTLDMSGGTQIKGTDPQSAAFALACDN